MVGKQPRNIVDNMSSEIGQYLLCEQLNAYDSRSNTSAWDWELDDWSVTSAHWSGKGKIKFTAKASFCGEHPWGEDESIFGADKVRLEIEGILVDPQSNYQFEIESIKTISGEENDLNGEFSSIF